MILGTKSGRTTSRIDALEFCKKVDQGLNTTPLDGRFIETRVVGILEFSKVLGISPIWS